jgi:predicted nucleotidyltransferase component of viral defense system
VTTRRPVKNVAASVRDRLLAASKDQGVSFNEVLRRYAMERLLYRISLSPHRQTLVLKGAMLFLAWTGHDFRPTKDVDFLGSGSDAPEDVATLFRDICAFTIPEPDGITFDPDSVRAEQIREEQVYGGVRVTLTARIASARIPVQADIGFGDAVTPGVEAVRFPCVLTDSTVPDVRAYSRYSVAAEKLEAMVKLGVANSRMKDFYDLLVLSRRFEFEGATLVKAITATFERRHTPLPSEQALVFGQDFANDPARQGLWQAFLNRTRLVEAASAAFPEVMTELRAFLVPAVLTVRHGAGFGARWLPGGPWQ